MPVDPMDDIELRSVQLQFSNGRGSLSGSCDLRRVVTDKGEVMVAVQGDTSKPAILTYHDLGLNCMYKYVSFFTFVIPYTFKLNNNINITPITDLFYHIICFYSDNFVEGKI